MAVRTISTKLALDGEKQFKQEMTAVNASLRAMRSELALAEAQFKGQANTVEALAAKDKLLRQEIEQQTVKVKALEQAAKDAAQVYGEDSAQAARYQEQLNRARLELLNMNNALSENTRYLDEAWHSADGAADSLDEFGDAAEDAQNPVNTLAGVLQAAGVAMTLKAIAASIWECVDASKKFETAMASFNKVAKLSKEDLAAMSDEIKRVSTEIPAITTEIAQVAEASRRLGIAQKNLMDFTKVMVDLGKVSDLSAAQAATALARFANIVGTSADDYDRLGSTIVALGNNFATSESEITEMASRLASAGKLAHLSEAQIMGLAAAMSSVGIEAEAGGTAMTQTLTAMEKAVTSGGKKLDEFARIAGMSSEEFSDAWQREPIEAIQAFISGLGSLDERGESATQVLEELGLSGIRQSNMLKSLALASETLTGTLATADEAWKQNKELAMSAAPIYETLEAKSQMAANAVNNLRIAVGDALSPALATLADTGTSAFSWAADFISQNPIIVSAFTGLITAAGVLAAGLTAYAAKAALATLASSAFGAALMATPIGTISIAIGALVGVFTAVAGAIDDAKDANEELRESLEKTKASLAESVQTATQNGDHLKGMADALIQLAEAEDRSSVQTQAMLEMIRQLNEAIPGLNLAYDEQTGKLNMTADAVRNLAAAEADRIAGQEVVKTYNDLLTQQAILAEQVAQAEAEYRAAMDETNATRELVKSGMESEKETLDELYEKQSAAHEVYNDLAIQMHDLKAAIKEIEDEYGDLISTEADNVSAVKDISEADAEAEDRTEELSAGLEELEKATKELTGAQDQLSKALKEQNEDGSLSLDTTLKLVEAGYSAALSIDAETGAVTLNREEYVRLAGAKIQEQLATLEVKQASIEAQRALLEEQLAAKEAALGYTDLAKQKALAAYAEDAKALELQIAALNRAMGALNSYSGATKAAARGSASASKQVKTQAQKDLEAYKQVKAGLDHDRAMGLVEEEAYYRRLEEYRDRYLTDQGNISEYRKASEQIYKYESSLAANTFKRMQAELDAARAVDLIDERTYYEKLAEYRNQYLTDEDSVEEYRKVTEQIYKYDKSLVEQEAQLWAEQSDRLIGELEERVKAVNSQQERMESRLGDYGDLFTVKDDKMRLESLKKQIDAIDRYEQALEGLQERGVTGGLMDEILGMDVNSATQYAKKLLAMSDSQWEEYNALWDAKQQRAAEVAEQFFKEQMDAVEAEYDQRMAEALDGLMDTAFLSGENTAQGLIDGLISKEDALYAQAAEMKSELERIFASVHIPSSAELAGNLSTARLQEFGDRITNRDLQKAVATGVNGFSTAMAGTGGGSLTIQVPINGRVLAETTIEDFRTVGQERPEIGDDR